MDPQTSESEPISQFTRAIQQLNDPDFGDFKRRSLLYLHRLMEAMDSAPPQKKEILKEMKYKLAYEPNLDITATLYALLDMAQSLKKD
jgi:hypothetical protein